MALKKKFADIEIPILESAIQILSTDEKIAGRTIKLDLTRKLRGKSLEVVFKIYEKDKKFIAQPKILNLMKFYITRMMRKGSDYVEDSFKTNCKDIKVTIKPFLITRKKVSRAVRNNLRRTAKDYLINYLKDKNYLECCYELFTGDLQRSMLPKLKKIYPLSFCEIRVFETKELDNANFEAIQVKPQEIKEQESSEDEQESPVQSEPEAKPEEQTEKKE